MNELIELRRRERTIAWAQKKITETQNHRNKISAHKVDYLSTLHSQPVDRKVSTQQVAAIMI